MSEALNVVFVMTRGPGNVPREVRVSVPLDGTSVEVGRAPYCQAVLDPWLLFASQVQCSLFCGAPPEETAATDDVTPARPPEGRHAVYITDMCSSNGTFVNETRISGTEPVELRSGDACIFGGMRDVPVGGRLPADAFSGPELVVWRAVVLPPGAEDVPEIAFEATPTVLPTPDVLEMAERDLLQTAQRSLRAAQPSVMDTPCQRLFDGLSPTAPPTVTKGPTAEGGGSDSPAVAQRLEVESPPKATEAVAEEVGATAVDVDAETETSPSAAPRRSGTVAAQIPATDTTEVLPAAPADAPFLAVRVGRHTFHVPEEALLAAAQAELKASPGKKRRADSAKGSSAHKKLKKEQDTVAVATPETAANYALQFTSSYWKWRMDDPNGTGKAEFHCMLPATSIQSIVSCDERLGLAVELRGGCQVPLVRPEVLQGGEENRWLAWVLEDTAAATEEVAEAKRSPTRKKKSPQKKQTAAKKTDVPAVSEESLHRFKELVAQIETFYKANKFPPPYMVDGETFDKIFAPSLAK